ncbi:MAG: hypothetical protein MJ158_00770 [Alphaproteobacteria bacterium]|nr:hypothetical protein [Alphaproteobacteria bacterium]
MNKCPFFNICGGCDFDFTDENYKQQKLSVLPHIDITDSVIWGEFGQRRRADFAFDDKHFGFYKKQSKDIIDISKCMNIVPEINDIIPYLSKLPWCGTGSVLVTLCENGIDVSVSADIPFFNTELKNAIEKLPNNIIRFCWNGKIIRNYITPIINFDDNTVEYTINAFLQPTKQTEKALRDLVIKHCINAKRVVDLFCGLGNFTFATKATGYDIVGNGIKRDLFKKPLTAKQLNNFDVIIMDPPRGGALAQTKEITKSNVKRIIYVSCNPNTFLRDKNLLCNAGYKITYITAVDQFVGSVHWEIFSVFEK